MKIPFFFAIAKTNKLERTLKTLDIKIDVDESQKEFSILIFKKGQKQYICYAREIENNIPPNTHSSTSLSGKWDIWLVHPQYIIDENKKIIYDDCKSSTIPFRILRKARRSNLNRLDNKRTILGPWTPKSYLKRVSFLADNHLYNKKPNKLDKNGMPLSFIKDDTRPIRVPWVFLGDSPEQLTEIDYDPTIEEIENDIEIEEKVLLSEKNIVIT